MQWLPQTPYEWGAAVFLILIAIAIGKDLDERDGGCGCLVALIVTTIITILVMAAIKILLRP
jgi:hypothetical protein